EGVLPRALENTPVVLPHLPESYDALLMRLALARGPTFRRKGGVPPSCLIREIPHVPFSSHRTVPTITDTICWCHARIISRIVGAKRVPASRGAQTLLQDTLQSAI